MILPFILSAIIVIIITIIAEKYGTEHHHFKLNMQDVCGKVSEIMGKLSEPLADASVIPTFIFTIRTIQKNNTKEQHKRTTQRTTQ